MNKAKLIHALADNLNSTFESINCGGCGLVAYFTHKALAKYGIDTTIFGVAWMYSAHTETNNVVKEVLAGERHYHDTPNTHIVLEWSGTCFDSDGTHHADLIHEPYEPQLFRKLITFRDSWNDMFMQVNKERGFNSDYHIMRTMKRIIDSTVKQHLEAA